jgi:hypothetical protein
MKDERSRRLAEKEDFLDPRKYHLPPPRSVLLQLQGINNIFLGNQG